MKRSFSDYLIAFMVIGCSLVLLGALTFALGGRGKPGVRSLEIDFTNVTGIREQSEVRYAGAPAGSVAAIRLLNNEERSSSVGQKRFNAVRVTVNIFNGVPDIPGDVRASISSDTLLSEKFIALSAGSPDAVPLENRAIIQGQSAASIDDLLGSVEPILKSVETTLNSLDPVVKKTTETLDSLKLGIEDALPRVSKVVDSAQSVAISAQTLLARADKLIQDNEGLIKEDLTEVKNALAKLQDVLKTSDKLMGNTDKEIGARMKEVSVVLQNLKVATTHVKAFATAIGERPNRVIFAGKPVDLRPESEILRSEKPLPATRQNTEARTSPANSRQ